MERESRSLDFRIFKDIDLREVAYPAGTEILGPQLRNDLMFVIKKGTVVVQIGGMTVETVMEGNIFGEMSIVDPKPHSASVCALTDVTLYAIDEQQFIQLVAKTPAFALRVMRILARRIRAMNARLTEAESAPA